MISLGRYLGPAFDPGLDSEISFALESLLRDSSVVFLSKFIEVDSILLNLIFGDSWKVVSFLEVLNSLWLGVGNYVGILHVEFLEVCCWLDCHTC